MRGRVRFSTAKQVFETFPRAARHIETSPGDEAPLDFGRKLLTRGRRFDAVVFGAFLLPRREAVWWGCQCLRALGDGDNAGLLAAEAWVRDPDDDSRLRALGIWRGDDRRLPGTWIAMAAGCSGGNLERKDGAHKAPAPHATAVGVKTAVILAISQAPERLQPRAFAACVEAWLRFAEGGDAKVRVAAS